MVVFVAHRGPTSELEAAIESVANQRGVRGRLAVIVGEDGLPTGCSPANMPDVPGKLVRCSLNAGNPTDARNDLIDLVRSAAPRCDALVRLDSDDRLASPTVLTEIESRVRSAAASTAKIDALLFGNLQARNGIVLPRPNLPESALLSRRGLLDRLAGMADEDPLAELPSCNLVLLRGSTARFPTLPSAEDHALVASLLMRRRVVIDDSLIQTIYRLGGNATEKNLRDGTFRESRRKILDAACGT